MGQGLQHIPENMAEIKQQVVKFRDTFNKTWLNKSRKTERILNYIFEVHMANILIIFQNFKVNTFDDTWTFLSNFERMFKDLEKEKSIDDSTLLAEIDKIG